MPERAQSNRVLSGAGEGSGAVSRRAIPLTESLVLCR